MASSRPGERGSAIIEFAFAGVTVIILLLVIFEMCLAMWSYHTLALAVKTGAVYASTKGQDCYTGYNCGVSVSDIVNRVLQAGVGLDANRLNLTFHSSDPKSTDITCDPASSCKSNDTSWPPSGGYVPNIDYIDISASYPAPMPIMSLFWPGQSLGGLGDVEFSASSRQVIQF